MVGKLIKKELNTNFQVTFDISDYYSKLQIEKLKENLEYKLQIKEINSKRTLQQNNFMWKCLELISQKENAGRTDSDYVLDLYCKMLEKSGAKYEYMMALPETKDELLKVFRAIKIVEYRDYNGKQMAVMKCFYGSSKMNTKEFSNLMETILDYAADIGLYINKEELYEL